MVDRRKTRLTPEGLRSIGAILKAARDAKNWSLRDLEYAARKFEASQFGEEADNNEHRQFGVSATSINRYENGFVKSPSLDILGILLEILEPVNPQTGKPYTLEEIQAVGRGEGVPTEQPES